MLFFGVFLALVFLYGLVSDRLARTVLTAPLFFTAGGVAFLLKRILAAASRAEGEWGARVLRERKARQSDGAPRHWLKTPSSVWQEGPDRGRGRRVYE